MNIENFKKIYNENIKNIELDEKLIEDVKSKREIFRKEIIGKTMTAKRFNSSIDMFTKDDSRYSLRYFLEWVLSKGAFGGVGSMISDRVALKYTNDGYILDTRDIKNKKEYQANSEEAEKLLSDILDFLCGILQKEKFDDLISYLEKNEDKVNWFVSKNFLFELIFANSIGEYDSNPDYHNKLVNIYVYSGIVKNDVFNSLGLNDNSLTDKLKSSKKLYEFCNEKLKGENSLLSSIRYMRTIWQSLGNGEDKTDVYINEDIKKYLDYPQIVFTGAPGTGKTYTAKSIARSYDENFEFVQFHPSMDYSDFVEGLKPFENDKGISFYKIDGIFKRFCRKVVQENCENNGFEIENCSDLEDFYGRYREIENGGNVARRYFVIDEINRADLSKVLGELMYCLEDGYRGLFDNNGNKNVVQTEFSNLKTYVVNDKGEIEKLKFDCFEGGFFIPKNVFIIGTMNDIDRSVESFDFALRRRFKWIEIKANDSFKKGLEGCISKNKDVNLDDINVLCERVKNMNEYISSNDKFNLNDQYHIGYAYFKDFRKIDDGLEDIFKTNIEPLLREYVRGRNQKDIEEFIDKCKSKLLDM